MTVLEDYRRRIEKEDLPRLRDSLDWLESGRMQLRRRGPNDADWVDVTPEHIKMLKQAVETYETILKRLDAESGAETGNG